MPPLKINKNYLNKRGITDPWKIYPQPNRKFNQAIIIPSYGESDYLPQTLSSLVKNDPAILQDTLVVVVVNHAEDADDFFKNDNEKTLRFLSTTDYLFTLGIVDAATQGVELPSKQAGVGLARKIGMDLALPYLTSKRSLLFSTDADTTVNSHYLKIVLDYFKLYNADAAVVGFSHSVQENPDLNNTIKEYEAFLLITAKKINEAGSPYGYVSMGSTMVCTTEAYTAVGGMSRKKVTEDFYFLQELAKFCGVHTIPNILVYPSPRPMSRVYLGTGFRMEQAQQGFEIKSLYYSKHAFTVLKKWIALGTSAWKMSLVELLDKTKSQNKDLKKFLLMEGIEPIWNNLQSSSPSENHFIRQFHRWFDSLKTIRILKYFTKIVNI